MTDLGVHGQKLVLTAAGSLWKLSGPEKPNAPFAGERRRWMVDEKDIEYGKIFHRQLDVIKEQEKLLDHKDREISDLKRGDELYRKWVADTHREYGDIIAEKDREIERLQTNIDVMKRALRWSEWEEDGDDGKERTL